MNNQTVWVLTIEHRHGTNTYVHETEAGALASLTEYVREWWGDMAERAYGEVPDTPDNDEAIITYFDSATDEYYRIEQATVLP